MSPPLSLLPVIAQIKESLPPTERSQKHVLEKLKQTWMEMSAEAKDPWEKKAAADKERYRRELAEEKAARQGIASAVAGEPLAKKAKKIPSVDHS